MSYELALGLLRSIAWASLQASVLIALLLVLRRLFATRVPAWVWTAGWTLVLLRLVLPAVPSALVTFEPPVESTLVMDSFALFASPGVEGAGIDALPVVASGIDPSGATSPTALEASSAASRGHAATLAPRHSSRKRIGS